jgi:ATP-binding protein involved in chromosome partitioning
MSQHEANAVLEPAATRVRDPLTGRSIWSAGLLKNPRIDGDTLRFTLQCTEQHTETDRMRMRTGLLRHIATGGWGGDVACQLVVASPSAPTSSQPKKAVRGMSGSGMQAHGGPIEKQRVEGVRHIVAVASGKGGVGKSTVATNLAVSMARSGLKVGLMDADVYGPSLPTMMKVSGRPIADENRRIIPLQAYGVGCMSVGFLVEKDEPIIWRGPMVMGLVRQFLQQVNWGELDVLVIDLPPGTGDAQLTLIQATDLSGAVIVTTPQDVAVLDAVRGIEMFRKLDVPIIGLVENMSWLDLPGGDRMYPFGQGGGIRTAARYDIPLITQIPLDTRIRAGGDAGTPAALSDDGSQVPFIAIAEAVTAALP